MNTKPACNTCRFWATTVAPVGLGECRRYPPAHAFEPGGRPSRVSPWTGAYFWCGEHKSSGRKVPTGQDRFVAGTDSQ